MNPGDLTTIDHVKAWLSLSGLVVADISQASPAVVTLQTKPNIPLVSGLVYDLAGAVGMVEANGSFVVTVLTPTTFSIPVDTTGAAAYVPGTAYLGLADPELQRLISACSAFIQSRINRRIPAAAYIETYNGTGGPSLLLAQYPIQSVSLLFVDGIAMPARPTLAGVVATSPGFFATCGGSGYTFDSVSVNLTGWIFPRGFQNVAVSYVAGFGVFDEAQTIPASGAYTLAPLATWSAGDLGVTTAAGVALTKVASMPSQGEYAYADGVWTFNAADAGVSVLLSYATVPYDVEQAARDMIGDWFKYRDRIGRKTEGIQGQTTSFVDVPIPSRAKGVLDQYTKVVPVAV